MNRLNVTLKVVTPLFLSGAIPRGEQPEFRAPSLRGALRYWYRAAIGGTINGASLKTLYDAESSIFGNTSQASSVVIRERWVKGKPQLQPRPYDPRQFSQDKIDPTKNCQTTGKNYLYWSVGLGDQPRYYFLPETTFHVSLESRIGVQNGHEKIVGAGFALWLLCHLGGIGSRARRTAGSLQVTKCSPLDDLPNFAIPASVNDLASHLRSGIQKIREHLGKSTSTLPTRYDVLADSMCKIWIITAENGQPWKKWEYAVETIGSYLCGFRNRRFDYPDVLNWINSNHAQPNTVQRAVFGLPLPFRYSNGTKGTVVGEIHEDRRASPLHLRIYQLSTGECVGIATLFMADFLDKDRRGNPEKLKLQWPSRPHVEAPSDFRLIEDFINSISPIPIEVPL
jgi:CRISPR-associated protein Cmr1